MENEPNTFADDEALQTNAKIKVIGVGGGGSNAVNGMIHDKESQVEYWVFNTDSQALAASPCENKLVLGKNVTRGLGAGGLPEMGRKAAEDSYTDIQLVVQGCDMVFIAAGEGGGTGTGAAPIVAKAAKECGCLVLAIVTRPFTFEGKLRKTNALKGIAELEKVVDALIVVSNDKMMFNNGALSISKAFKASDEILASSVKTVTDLILVHGIINLDFADVKATLSGKGLALIGIGTGTGKNKAVDAATNAITSPLLEASIRGSKSMLINITVGEDTTLDDVQYAINYITEAAGGKDNDVNIIFGVQQEPSFKDEMKVAIIATDFDKSVDVLNSEETSAPSRAVSVPVMPEEKKPAEEPVLPKKEESHVEKEIEKNRSDSVLPDYLKEFFEQEGKEDTSDLYPPVKENMPSEDQENINDVAETEESAPESVDEDDDEDDAITIDRKI